MLKSKLIRQTYCKIQCHLAQGSVLNGLLSAKGPCTKCHCTTAPGGMLRTMRQYDNKISVVWLNVESLAICNVSLKKANFDQFVRLKADFGLPKANFVPSIIMLFQWKGKFWQIWPVLPKFAFSKRQILSPI